ncbi:MAG: AI-2E family transporter [Geobacteraceae bacterium]|nr:AI-2E family transporter [Geobacteraceae bacterium]
MNITRSQFLFFYLVMTAALASGLAIFSSASTIALTLRSAAAGIFVPLILALATAFVLDPVVSRLEKYHIPRSRSTLAIFFLILTLLWFSGSWLVTYTQQMWISLVQDFPRYSSGLIKYVKEAQISWQEQFPFLIQYDLTEKVPTPKSALKLGSLLILVPIFAFFFIRDGANIRRNLIALAPNRYFEMAHDLSYLISRQTSRFVRGRIIEASIIGMCITAGLSLTDIRYAPLLGLFAGITNLVPYVGPLVGMIPGLTIALIDLGFGPQFWWIVILYVLISQVILDNFILIPILISRYANLHPLLVIVAIIMGGKIYGVLGMIIGVPILSACKIAFIQIRHYRRAFSLPDTGTQLPR